MLIPTQETKFASIHSPKTGAQISHFKFLKQLISTPSRGLKKSPRMAPCSFSVGRRWDIESWARDTWSLTDRPWLLWCHIKIHKLDMSIFRKGYIYMGVEPKIMVPPSHPLKNRVFHYTPSILGYPYFWKHPYLVIFICPMVLYISCTSWFWQRWQCFSNSFFYLPSIYHRFKNKNEGKTSILDSAKILQNINFQKTYVQKFTMENPNPFRRIPRQFLPMDRPETNNKKPSSVWRLLTTITTILCCIRERSFKSQLRSQHACFAREVLP